MKVEVELEDLETIVFATAVIKTIEGQLAARKQDPFVRPHLAYSAAHDNLVAAMNHARRADADTKTAWDGELDKKEAKLLQELTVDDIGMIHVSGDRRMKDSEIDALSAKGCIQIGQCVEGAVWSGADRADIRPLAKFAIRITRRGHDKFEKYKLAQLEKLTHAAKS